MAVNFWINKITFKNGKSISLQKNSIVVFVGPNNSGKSRVLKEISETSSHKYSSAVIVDNADVSVDGSFDNFLSTIEHRNRNGIYRYYGDGNSGMHANSLKDYWDSAFNKKNQCGAPAIANFFVNTLTTNARLNLINPVGNIDVITELKTHPIHELKYDSEKEKVFSKYFKMAFGEDVIVNHGYGAKVPLHVGTPPFITAENDRVSSIYQEQLRELPFLHEQGDGMKSFAGVFLSLFAQHFNVQIIDEPEAFTSTSECIVRTNDCTNVR